MRLKNLFIKKGTTYLTEAPSKENSVFFKASAKTIKYKKQSYRERENFEYPNMTLYEIARAEATDSYIAQSLNKYKEKIFKAGYRIDGEEAPRDYIKKRLALMSFMNETIFDILLQEIADDIVVFQNAYLLKLRVDTIPFVKAIAFNNDKIVGGYMRLDPCEIIIVKDRHNNVLRYELEQEGFENAKIKKEDIIHFYMNRKGTDKQGTSRLEPVLEDVKALRDIEGDVLTLIHRFCFPMYHIKVGLAQNGYSGNEGDIEDIKYEIENMSEDGMLVTNEKVEIKTVGAEGNALDMKSYLDYFEKRVFSGLNTSESQMGRNETTTPDSLEAQIHDSVKHIQRHLALFIEHEIYNELLLEGGFNPILNEEDRVRIVFNEISLDTRVKLENHEALKYQSNIQTLKETRSAVGKPETVDENDLYIDNITNYAADVQTRQKTDGAIALAKVNAKLQESQQTTVSSKTQVVDKANNNTSQKATSLSSNNMPENQHGVYSVKLKESLDVLAKNQEQSDDIIATCYKLYAQLNNGSHEKQKINQERLIEQATRCVLLNIEHAEAFAKNALGITTQKAEEYIAQEVKKAFKKLFKELNKENLQSKAYRVRFIIDYWSKKYFWYCFCLIQKQEGVKMLFIHFNRLEESQNRQQKINLTTFEQQPIGEIFLLIPPYHPYCQCKITLKNERSRNK